jgi:poly(A) polymerase
MHDLWNAVSKNRILERILPALPPGTYLVGGCVRDLLLGRQTCDIDLVCFSDAWELSRRIAEIVCGKAFWLDRQRHVVRVASKTDSLTIDVSPPRGPDILSDLKARDITINAMACEVAAWGGQLIDPLRGLSDLRQGIIRIISEHNLLDDPLRGMRCLRFAVMLGFTLSSETRDLVRNHAGMIRSIAPERIKHEFLKALSVPRGTSFFRLMADEGYVGEIFSPQGGTAEDTCSSSRLTHALKMASRVDEVLLHVHTLLPGIKDHFSKEVEHGLSREAAIRLAAFLAGIAAEPVSAGEAVQRGRLQFPRSSLLAEDICMRLSLSCRACRIVGGAIAGYRKMLDMAQYPQISRKDMHKVFQAGPESIPEALCLAEASTRTATDPSCASSGANARVAAIWEFYLGEYKGFKENPLITGDDIMAEFNLSSGPRIGEYLEKVLEARVEGTLVTREDALEYLRGII